MNSRRHSQLYMLHYCLQTPNKILYVHALVAQLITKRTTLGRTVAIFACSAGSGEEMVELTVECRCGGDRRSRGLFRGSSAGGHSRPLRKVPVESPYGYSAPTGNPLAAQKNANEGAARNCFGPHEQVGCVATCSAHMSLTSN